MGDLGDALELMHGARHRFRSLRATIGEWHDGPLGRRALERYAQTRDGHGFERVLADEGDDRWQTREGVWRLWVEKPDKVREERDDPLHGSELGIKVDELWWMYDREYGPYSNDDDPSVGSGVGQSAELLLDPSPLLGPLRFEPVGRSEVAGRETIRLRGEVRGGGGHSFALFRLGPGVRQVEIAVDAEVGILLGQAAMLDGAPYHRMEFREVACDESFPPETFKFVLPAGETRRPGDEPEAREVTLEEAVVLATFPFFTLDLEDEWLCQPHYYPGNGRHDYPEVVSLHFRLPDASHRLFISERPAGSKEHLDDYLTWETREYEGEEVEVSPQERPMETRVRLEREGTSITLSSETLDLDQLLRLTRSLRRLVGASSL